MPTYNGLVRAINIWLPRSWYGWFVKVLAFVIMIGNTGFWPMPNLHVQHFVSQNLTHNPFPDPNAHYLFTNYFQPALFGVFGGRTLLAYAIYTAVMTAFFFSLS